MEFHEWKEADNLLIVTNNYKITEEKLKRLNPDIQNWNSIEKGTKVRIK